MNAETPPADFLAAINFRYFIFDTRDRLLECFNRARAALKEDGVVFVEQFGRPEAQEETREKTRRKRLSCIGHQVEFHMVTPSGPLFSDRE